MKPFSLFKKINNKALIIGHRGHFYEVENSLNAFKKAISDKLYGVELDIWLTKDNIPVVIHTDSDTNCISKTSNGKGLVKDFTFSELKEFNLERNEKIPSLEEVFEISKDLLVIDVEIKEKERKEEIVEEVMKLVSKYSNEKQIFFSSFDHEYYEIIRKRSEIEFKYLANEYDQIKDVDVFSKKNASVCFNSNMINEELMNAYVKNDIPVSIYFYPDNKIDYSLVERLLNLGVTHFIVDEPVSCQSLFDEYYNKKENK